jgi:glycosyltransferase involved in cell wall biosynthesis
VRILFLNWRDSRNPEAGGAEVFVQEVAARWIAGGHEVVLLTSGFPGAPRHENIDGVSIRRIGHLRKGSFHLLVQRELARLREFDAVVEGINTIPFFTPLWRRLPPTVALIYQLAVEVWDTELPRHAAHLARWIEPQLLRPYRTVPVVTISQSGKRELLGAGLRDVTVIEPGRSEVPPLRHTADEPVPTVMFAGRLAANKRPDHAVEAFRLIKRNKPDARLWIVGQGPMAEVLRRSLPEDAQLLGHVSRTELYERMARAHCLLVPSVREGWGLVVTEANAVGTPAVGYDVPGLRDSIHTGETGLLAEAGNPAALAREAERLLDDAELRGRMSECAERLAGSFSWSKTAASLLEVIHDRAFRAQRSRSQYDKPRRHTQQAREGGGPRI